MQLHYIFKKLIGLKESCASRGERLQSVILQMCEIVVHLLSTIPVSQIFLTINKQFLGGKAMAWQITRNFPSPMPSDVTLDKASSMKCNGLDNFVVAIK